MVRKYKKLYDDLDDVKDRLIQSEKRYRLLVENASDAIMVLQDGMFKFGNDNDINGRLRQRVCMKFSLK